MTLSHGIAGSIIMDITALFILTGLLIYTAIYRQRGRLDDRLFFSMVIVNIVLAAADCMTYMLEGKTMLFGRELMIAGNMIFSAAFEIFSYLFILYLDYRAFQSERRIRLWKLIYSIPALILIILLFVNLDTGILFSVTDGNSYQSGPYYYIVFIPVGIYILGCALLCIRINIRLIFLCVLLVAARLACGIWFRDVSSTAVTYTLFLVCTHIYMMNRSLSEE